MGVFKNMTLKLKFIIILSIVDVIFIGQGVYQFVNNNQLLSEARRISTTEMPLLGKLHAVKLNIVQVQQWLTDISATRGLDGLDDGFKEAEKHAQRFHGLINELSALDPSSKQSYQALIPAFDAYYQTGKKMAQAYVNDGPASGNKMMPEFDVVAAKITQAVDSMLPIMQKRVATALQSEEQTAAKAMWTLIISSIVILSGLAVLYVIMVRELTRLPKLVSELANGDLSQSFETDRKDEVGQIMGSLASMRDRMLTIIHHVQHLSADLNESSQKMTSISSTSGNKLNDLCGETEQSAAAMNEMSATTHEVSGNILQTSEAAQEANTEAQEGQKIVDRTIDQIRNLATQINQASETIHQLEKDSADITTVLDVIRGVAEQTNLLALNAAIEAARAGEQGRGFAVVADEVRTLAGRTQQSTEEINQMINKFQNCSQDAVKVMNASCEQANNVVKQATTAGVSLANIAQAVAKISDMSHQIASAAEEQSAVAEEVNRSIVRINDMANETRTGTEQVVSTSQQLNRMAAEIESLTADYRT